MCSSLARHRRILAYIKYIIIAISTMISIILLTASSIVGVVGATKIVLVRGREVYMLLKDHLKLTLFIVFISSLPILGDILLVVSSIILLINIFYEIPLILQAYFLVMFISRMLTAPIIKVKHEVKRRKTPAIPYV